MNDQRRSNEYCGGHREDSENYRGDSQAGVDHIQRGRRRNSSSARNAARSESSSLAKSATSLPQTHRQRHHVGNQKGDDIEPHNSSSLFCTKRVRVVLPEVDIDEPQHREVPPQATSDPQSKQIKSALHEPRDRFPEDPNFLRPGVAPMGQTSKIPPGARWTKISRRIISTEALDVSNERYEEREDYIDIVLRLLTREDVEQYAVKTQEIRARRTPMLGESHTNTERGSGNNITNDSATQSPGSSRSSFEGDRFQGFDQETFINESYTSKGTALTSIRCPPSAAVIVTLLRLTR